MHTKFIFVTGGVVSSLGKGITAASLGRLLKSRGLRVSMQKFDPYINVDPGTMNPYQHGEVFVTDDGAETDLDLGHYERFIDENLTQAANVTSGRVYDTVITRERKGEYLGATIQVIPHITDEMHVALAISAAGDPNAQKAMQALDKLKCCEVHSTVILSSAAVCRKHGSPACAGDSHTFKKRSRFCSNGSGLVCFQRYF